MDRAAYLAFDRFPSAKGAATHIAQMADALFEHYGGGRLIVAGAPELPAWQREQNVEIHRARMSGATPLARALSYANFAAQVLARKPPEVVHYRDIWSGIAVERACPPATRRVFEVNGLPSIEWAERYPALADSTLAKLRALEAQQLAAADRIIVPAATIAHNLARWNVELPPLTVVPNGADLPELPSGPPPLATPYILYFGALQAWQGVADAIAAMAMLADLRGLMLVIASSSPERHAEALQNTAQRLGVAGRILWLYELPRPQLVRWIAGARCSVAPFTQCARNLLQGFAPLKVLESLAAGVPVVASDLPAVREIVRHGEHGLLVRPERPGELARALRTLLDDAARRDRLGCAARQHVADNFSWRLSRARLSEAYRALHVVKPAQLAEFKR
ncbi:MAG: glycosyltransferase family 4 protein [Rhodocyclaceae bacterium]|nr:glycosyltransferase family 4 protein [Rhodocyclaceae bacterium]MBX3669359.1 glycosyltransferase family 4 protein [Rhodocyclaceae bacterium]